MVRPGRGIEPADIETFGGADDLVADRIGRTPVGTLGREKYWGHLDASVGVRRGVSGEDVTFLDAYKVGLSRSSNTGVGG